MTSPRLAPAAFWASVVGCGQNATTAPITTIEQATNPSFFIVLLLRLNPSLSNVQIHRLWRQSPDADTSFLRCLLLFRVPSAYPWQFQGVDFLTGVCLHSFES